MNCLPKQILWSWPIWWLMLDVNLAGSRITHETNLPSHLRETTWYYPLQWQWGVILITLVEARSPILKMSGTISSSGALNWMKSGKLVEYQHSVSLCSLAVSTMWPAVPGSCCLDFHPHGPWAKVKPSFPELLLPRHLVTSTGKKLTPGRNLSCYQQS